MAHLLQTTLRSLCRGRKISTSLRCWNRYWGIWTPTSFNDWGTPVVPVRKAAQTSNIPALRVCGGYSVTVNPQLETHRHPLPLPEKLMRRLGGGYGFTKTDLADAYNQVSSGPKSRDRLALSTHCGVLLQNVLPFGVSSAPGNYQWSARCSRLPGRHSLQWCNSRKSIYRISVGY